MLMSFLLQAGDSTCFDIFSIIIPSFDLIMLWLMVDIMVGRLWLDIPSVDDQILRILMVLIPSTTADCGLLPMRRETQAGEGGWLVSFGRELTKTPRVEETCVFESYVDVFGYFYFGIAFKHV